MSVALKPLDVKEPLSYCTDYRMFKELHKDLSNIEFRAVTEVEAME